MNQHSCFAPTLVALGQGLCQSSAQLNERIWLGHTQSIGTLGGRAARGHGREVRLDVENAGSARVWRACPSRTTGLIARLNPILWDGIRTPAPPLAPGSTTVSTAVRARFPPGRYRLALDLVAEHRAWFSELGSSMLARDVDVEPRPGEPVATQLPEGWERAEDWEERVRAAHAEGYGVVAGAVTWPSGLLHRRPKELAPYEPGQGHVPGFSAPLLAPWCSPAWSSSRSARSPACRRSRRRDASRGLQQPDHPPAGGG